MQVTFPPISHWAAGVRDATHLPTRFRASHSDTLEVLDRELSSWGPTAS